jgi:2-hydroxychromene-2-carboxylate isomerase
MGPRLRGGDEMAMTTKVEFWFAFASTYSYLTAMRIGEEAKRAGVALDWRAFLLGPVMAQVGWNDSPFNVQPVKGRYMWRDIERICERYGLPWRKPSRFPRNGLLAARVATAARGEAWLPDFVRAVYRANFAEDRDISRPEVLREILGTRAEEWLARAGEQAVKEALRAATDEAMRRGIFGAPSFFVLEELFWGDDRLDQALAWAERG